MRTALREPNGARIVSVKGRCVRVVGVDVQTSSRSLPATAYVYALYSGRAQRGSAIPWAARLLHPTFSGQLRGPPLAAVA